MVTKFSRAQRRHDRVRLKRKRQYYWGYGYKQQWYARPPENSRGEIDFMSPRTAGLIVNTAKPCSCQMCCNWRKSAFADNPLTLQEQRALHSFYDQIEEMDLP